MSNDLVIQKPTCRARSVSFGGRSIGKSIWQATMAQQALDAGKSVALMRVVDGEVVVERVVGTRIVPAKQTEEQNRRG